MIDEQKLVTIEFDSEKVIIVTMMMMMMISMLVV
jgi:hypothetical protein